jgi:menaquinone-specific isochorismate synthase
VDGPVPLLDHRPDHVWLAPGIQLVGWGEALRVAAGYGTGRFERGRAAVREWASSMEIDDEVAKPGSGPVAFSSFTFDPRSPGSVIIVPEILFGKTEDRWFVTTLDDVPYGHLLHPSGTGGATVDRPRYAGGSIPDVHWMEAVAEAVAEIADGAFEKVVLARDFAIWSKAPFDTRVVLERLHERFPECFTFLVDGLVGASPELLVRKTGTRVESVALAGSAGRGADAAEDERMGRALLDSDKDRREHEMAALTVETALSEIARRVVRDAEPSLLRLANVQHLATRFRGTLDEGISILQAVAKLHPTAAVGGWPIDEALDAIRRLEGMDRGRYAGPVGWFDLRDDGEFAIALRCAELSGARARLFAGAGIVRGSLPETELEETRLKLRAMLDALEA